LLWLLLLLLLLLECGAIPVTGCWFWLLLYPNELLLILTLGDELCTLVVDELLMEGFGSLFFKSVSPVRTFNKQE
jgi:hypothetical protein